MGLQRQVNESTEECKEVSDQIELLSGRICEILHKDDIPAATIRKKKAVQDEIKRLMQVERSTEEHSRNEMQNVIEQVCCWLQMQRHCTFFIKEKGPTMLRYLTLDCFG